MTESKDFAAVPVKDWQVARSLVEPLYAGQFLNSGESRLAHSDGMASILKGLNEDDNLLTAAYLFSVHMYVENADEWIEKKIRSVGFASCSGYASPCRHERASPK